MNREDTDIKGRVNRAKDDKKKKKKRKKDANKKDTNKKDANKKDEQMKLIRHQLRNNLNNINGCLTLLNMIHHDEKSKEYCKMMEEGIQQMLSAIDNLS